MSLRSAYEKNDIKTIQKLLQNKNNDIFRNQEFAQYLEDLLRNIRLNVLTHKVAPYKTVKLDFLAQELNISSQEVRQLLAELILEKRVDGQID